MVGSEGPAAVAIDFPTALPAVGRELAPRCELTRVVVRVLRRAPVSGKPPGSDDMAKCFFAVDNTQQTAIFVSSFLEGYGAARAVFWPLPRALVLQKEASPSGLPERKARRLPGAARSAISIIFDYFHLTHKIVRHSATRNVRHSRQKNTSSQCGK